VLLQVFYGKKRSDIYEADSLIKKTVNLLIFTTSNLAVLNHKTRGFPNRPHGRSGNWVDKPSNNQFQHMKSW